MKTISLNGDLEDVLTRQHEGFIMPGPCLPFEEIIICFAIVSRQLCKRFDRFITEHGYENIPYENYVNYMKLTVGSMIYLFLYVDDIFIPTLDMNDILELKRLSY